ncbi:MAG: RES family NAD+ phosphorylase [Rhizobiaceae bacterium]
MKIWRISNFADLSGRGGLLSAGRWNFRGTPVVYCADHPATALLEMIVHVDPQDLPASYQLLDIDVPDGTAIAAPALPDDWRTDIEATRRIGSDFVAAGREAVMAVPCAIVPQATNYLLAPALLGRDGITVLHAARHAIDERLLG